VAVIEKFERSDRSTFRIQPTSVVCFYAVFEPTPKKKVLQLDTGGSAGRKNPGKQSQTLQLDADAAHALWKLLTKEFGFSA